MYIIFSKNIYDFSRRLHTSFPTSVHIVSPDACPFIFFFVTLERIRRKPFPKTSLEKSIRYYFAFSQKPRKLVGNNVAEIIVR